MTASIHIETFALGDWQTNCYLVTAADSTDCWIVDAGFDPQPMIAAIRKQNLSPTHILLTHAHLDHIGGLEPIHNTWPDIPILIHDAETTYLTDPVNNLSAMWGQPVIAPQSTGTLTHGQTLTLAGQIFEVRHTPGHSPGGVTLYHAPSNQALVGDTLFASGIGRFDFPHSDGATLMRSIHDQLMTLPDDVRIYPGHGPASTIGRERATNPYLQL